MKKVRAVAPHALHQAIRQWRARAHSFHRTGNLAKPDLTFAQFVAARNACEPGGPGPGENLMLQLGFFCNTNRLRDTVTKELETAIMNEPREVAVGTIFLLRMMGSPRQNEHPGMSGALPIATALRNGTCITVEDLRFSGRKTYRAVLSREELNIIHRSVTAALSNVTRAASLEALRDRVDMCIKSSAENHQQELLLAGTRGNAQYRKLCFHCLQIACDWLHNAGRQRRELSACERL